MAAIGGIMAASRLLAVNQSSGGSDLLLLAIAGPVIAGTSLFGGRGSGVARAARRARDRLDLERHGPARARVVGEVHGHRRGAARRGDRRRDRAPASGRRRDGSEAGRAGASAPARRRSPDEPSLGHPLHRAHHRRAAGKRKWPGVRRRRLARSRAGAGLGRRAGGAPCLRVLRGSARRPGDRRRLQPVAQRTARRLVDPGAGGGQARPVREAAEPPPRTRWSAPSTWRGSRAAC